MARISQAAQFAAIIEAQNAQIAALAAKLDEFVSAKPAEAAPAAKPATKSSKFRDEVIVPRAQRREAAGKPARVRDGKVARVQAAHPEVDHATVEAAVDAKRAIGRALAKAQRDMAK